MSFRLPRLQRSEVITEKDGVPTMGFQRWWASVMKAIEDILTSIAALVTAVSNKNAVFVQTTAPTATAVNDLWLDSDDGYKPLRWSGTAWEEVQDIGAAYALLGVNSDGTIKTDKVETASIVSEGVTTKTYAFTAASVNITAGGYTYQEVQSATIITTGEDVEVEFFFELNVIDNCKYKYKVLRDASDLLEVGPITVSTADGPPAFFKYVDSPVAGTYEYTLEVACNDAGDIDVLNRGLNVKEIKR